jgi:hypothetical protein
VLQACQYEDNTAESDGGADGQCYSGAAHERGTGSVREQGARALAGADAVAQEQWESVVSPGPYRDAYPLTVDTYVLDFH